MTVRVPLRAATDTAIELLRAAGMDKDASVVVADLLVEADRLGRSTHGLRLLVSYLDEIRSGAMTPTGRPVVVRDDDGPVLVWDAQWRSGVWSTSLAVDAAAARAQRFGIGMVSIRRTHHIASLQAYLLKHTDAGLITFVTCSDPAGATVSPYGGIEPVLQPDPLAIGLPTDDSPILIDISTSTTANAVALEAAASGKRLPGQWLQTAEGIPTDDPAVLAAEPPGTILPAGGADHGHKGYGLAVAVEALTQGLAGYGRADPERRWGASVLVEVLDPERFSGLAAFTEQSGALARRIRSSLPGPGVSSVRVPGDAALARRADALDRGILMTPSTIAAMIDACRGQGLALPPWLETAASR